MGQVMEGVISFHKIYGLIKLTVVHLVHLVLVLVLVLVLFLVFVLVLVGVR